MRNYLNVALMVGESILLGGFLSFIIFSIIVLGVTSHGG